MQRVSQPTIDDVARLAGVSTATISRAINMPDRVAKATRDKIEKAIETLGYTPNYGGRLLASNRTNTVAAVIPTMSNAMFASGVQAFQEVLAGAGVNLLIASTGYDPDEEFRQIRALMANGAEGFLLIGKDRAETTLALLKKRDIPYVTTWCFGNDPDQLYAGFDNEKAAFDATRQVLLQGHRRIAMIAGITIHNDRARDRVTGVMAAIATQPGARLVQVIEARYRLEAGADAMEAILSSVDRPTAVMCGSDVLAAAAIVRASELGVRVPQDVSVVGFDDIGLARVVTPALTTVRVPQTDMGQAAARLLLARRAGEVGLKSQRFEAPLILRGSLAPPGG